MADGDQPGADRVTTVASPARRRQIARMIELAPLLLVIVAEAAWISVLGGLLQEFAIRRSVLGIPVLAAFVAVGVVAARLGVPRLGSRWPFAALGLAALGGLLGWAISEDARAALQAGVGPGLAAHPGGLVGGLAVIRGYAHTRMPLAEDTVARLLSVGVPGLALVSVLGGVIGEPIRSAFLGEALGAAIVFVGAAALALAFTRVDDVGRDGGFDWRRNPPWLLVTVVVLVLAIAIAIPLAAIAGSVLSVVISVALAPALLLGLASGFDRTARRLILSTGLTLILLYLFTGGPLHDVLPVLGDPALGGDGQTTGGEQVIAASLGGLLLVAALIGVVLLIALWMRRSAPADAGVDELRAIDRGGDGLAPPRRRRGRFGRRPEPTSGAEAYVALMDDLERHPVVRREAAETPASHAARLRSEGLAGLSLELLAADYALDRYGGVALTRREDERAIGRWRMLRRELARAAPPKPGATEADRSVPAAGTDAVEGAREGFRAG
jgi:hypothetical protein